METKFSGFKHNNESFYVYFYCDYMFWPICKDDIMMVNKPKPLSR